MEEVKDLTDIQFEDLELDIKKPVLAKETNVPMVSGNFEELSSKIKALVNKYKDTELTDSNVNYVKTLKSHFVSLRTGIEKARKDWKAIYISPMETSVDSMCKDLQKLVEEGEMSLKNQLDAYDQKRKDQLTEILQDYVKEAVVKYELREEYASQIELKSKFYNLTQKEDDSIADIESQAEELGKKQTEHDSAVELINAECKGTTLVPETYIRQLIYKSPMELIMQIKMDKKKAEELYNEMKAKEGTDEKVVIGEKVEDVLKESAHLTEKEDKTELRERVLRVRYLPSQAKLMADFFKKNRIQFEFIKEQ